MTDLEHSFFAEMEAQIRRTPLPSRTPRRRPRPRSLAGASAAVAALAVTLALLLGLSAGGTTTPAYAVTIRPDHGVTIVLTELHDISRLNARLATLRTRIRAVPVVPGCVAPVHSVIGAYDDIPAHIAPGPPRTLMALVPAHIRVFSETIENRTLPGRTLIIPVTHSGQQTGFAVSQGDVVIGPAPRCVGESPTR